MSEWKNMMSCVSIVERKDVRKDQHFHFYFEVKFYPIDPVSDLHHEFTRSVAVTQFFRSITHCRCIACFVRHSVHVHSLHPMQDAVCLCTLCLDEM